MTAAPLLLPSKAGLKVTTRRIVDEFERQNIRYEIMFAEQSLVAFWDAAGNRQMIFSTVSHRSSTVSYIIANDKALTINVARSIGIPLPITEKYTDTDRARQFMRDHKRIVVKPVDASHGNGVTTDVTNNKTLSHALRYAHKYANTVLLQQQVGGKDYRLLIINGKFSSAVERSPAAVIGDGTHTVRQLIHIENLSSYRAAGYLKSACKISLEAAKIYLEDELDSIPLDGVLVRCVGPANISMGGTISEATTTVSDAMIESAEHISKELKLEICGVDFMFDGTNYYLLEINDTPGIDIHDDPFWGTKSDCFKAYVTWLYNSAS